MDLNFSVFSKSFWNCVVPSRVPTPDALLRRGVAIEDVHYAFCGFVIEDPVLNFACCNLLKAIFNEVVPDVHIARVAFLF